MSHKALIFLPNFLSLVNPQNVCWPMAGTLESVILISSNCLNCEKIGPIVMEFLGPRIIRIVTLASRSASGKDFNPPVKEWYESLMIDPTLFIYELCGFPLSIYWTDDGWDWDFYFDEGPGCNKTSDMRRKCIFTDFLQFLLFIHRFVG